MARDVLAAIGAGLFGAILSVSPLAFIAPLPLLAAGLALGVKSGVIATAVAFAAKLFVDSIDATQHFALVQALPAVIVMYLALTQEPRRAGASATAPAEWRSVGSVAAALGVWGAVLLVGATLMIASGSLSQEVAASINTFFDQFGPNFPDELRQRYLGQLLPIFPGLITAILMLVVAANAAFAQGILVRIDKSIRPKIDYAAFELPSWAAWPLVIAATMSLLGSGEWQYLWRNLAMIFALPYFLLGLAVVHTLARKVAFTGPLLMAFYMVIVLSLWAGLVVAGIGVVEQWFGLRGRTQTSLPQRGDDEDN